MLLLLLNSILLIISAILRSIILAVIKIYKLSSRFLKQ